MYPILDTFKACGRVIYLFGSGDTVASIQLIDLIWFHC